MGAEVITDLGDGADEIALSRALVPAGLTEQETVARAPMHDLVFLGRGRTAAPPRVPGQPPRGLAR